MLVLQLGGNANASTLRSFDSQQIRRAWCEVEVVAADIDYIPVAQPGIGKKCLDINNAFVMQAEPREVGQA